jgi:glycosyltransferase involved in cell wall biosynthesis
LKERICIVVSSVMTVNAFLLEPIKLLSKHYQVYIIINGHADELAISLDNVEVLSVAINRKISLFRDLFSLLHLIIIFWKYDFKLVHSVTPKAGLLAMIAAFVVRVPVRIHIFTGQVWATKAGFTRWALKHLDRIIAILATDILIDSSSQRQFLLNEDVVSVNKSSVLAQGSISGVDMARFTADKQARLKLRKELNISDENIVFLFIGRLNKDKGVLDLAVAFSSIAETNAYLLIVGPNESGIRKDMESVLSDCLDRVKFIGFTAVPEQYMSAADCLCLPSYREGFGSVVIEAASVGIPTIGSKIYGVEDALVDGITGLLFQAKNIKELRACMIKIIIEEGLCQKLGENARKRVIEHFSSQDVALAWLDYYQVKL